MDNDMPVDRSTHSLCAAKNTSTCFQVHMHRTSFLLFLNSRLSSECFPCAQPENIVLKDDSAEQLKIIDFGTAQDLSINPSPVVMVGTPEFIGESPSPSLHECSLITRPPH